MSKQPRMTEERLVALADAYLVGELTAEQLAELERELVTSPASLAMFLSVAEQASSMREIFGQATQWRGIAEGAGADADEAAEFLTILSSLEAPNNEPPAPIDFTEELARRQREQKKQAWQERRTAEYRRRARTGHSLAGSVIKATVWLGLAACLGLVVWLGWPESEQRTNAATTPTVRDLDKPASSFAVKILSTDGAAWGNGARYTAGSTIAPSDVTLTQGRAVLMFGSGARVILHGPTHLTVVDETACQLHAGKLQGLATDLGYGFEVFVPGGVVTDLGAAFDIDVAADVMEPARVRVASGAVRVANVVRGRRAESVHLVQSQFADIQADGSAIAAFTPETRSVRLDAPSSGIGLSHGEIDPHWSIRSADDGRWQPAVVVDPFEIADTANNITAWLPSYAGSSRWLALQARPAIRPEGVYAFRTTITIPSHVDPDSVVLRVRYLADDAIQSIQLGGRRALGPQSQPRPDLDFSAQEQFQTWSEFRLDQGFVSGENEFVIEIENRAGATGLRVEFTLEGTSMYQPLPRQARR